MAVTVYRSSDASAPVMTGQVGSFLAILQACLVVGYGAKSAAGWAREFTGTNLGVYRAASGNRFRLAVDDTNAQEARIVGYESMSAVTTGTAPFPTAAQQSGGLYMRKSETADATARPWVLVACDTSFYFFPNSGGTDWLTAPLSSYISGQMFFGDLVSFKPSDAYGSMIIGASASGGNASRLGECQTPAANITASPGHYITRDYAAVAGAKPSAKVAALDHTANGTCFGYASGGGWPVYPDLVTGGMLISPIYIMEQGTTTSVQLIRGRLPGLWAPLHASPANHADTMDGSGTDTSGKSFLLFSCASTSQLGRALVETTNTW